jgi:general secretion pathway protein E
MEGPYLEIQSSGGMEQLAVGAKPITIGRHGDNELALGDPKASRFHAVIERNGSGFRIRDLKSSNGTFVNGQRISEQELSPGDVVFIGSTRIVLLDPSAEPAPMVDVFEELSEDDVVEEVEAEASYGGAHAPTMTDRSGDTPDLDPHQILQELAESMGQKPFSEYDIALVSSRGTTVHEAAQPKKGDTRREAVDLFRLLLLVCFRSRATDIHLEPKNSYWLLRMRVDGNMVDVVRLAPEMGVRMSALVKVCSDVDIAQRNVIQEGHFSARVPAARAGGPLRRVDYRVSFAPSVFGQKLVIRILDTANAPLTINDLSLPKWMLEELRIAIEGDAGMILVVGPTGSGKTTSLYATVRSLDLGERNVVTIEDPVEIQIEGVTQIPVDEENGKGFSQLLRSVLRQDPDAILVGEIRDPETARIAMQAAITGHLVFSTLHTKDTVGTVFRLLDLGVEPYLVAQALHIVLAQRLVRKLCPHCRIATAPTEAQLKRMGKWGEGVSKIYEPRGCPRCLGTGHVGRRALFELLSTTDELRSLFLKNPSMDEIRKALEGTEFVRLKEHGYQLVAEGACSIEEVERAVGK